jgi:hypothetical protein
MRLLLIVLAVLCGVGSAHAQSTAAQSVTGYINSNGNFVPYDTTGAGIPVLPPVSTYQGTLAVTTSAPISNLTLSAGTFPTGAIGNVSISNVGSNTAYVCWFGGTCSATVGQPVTANTTVAKNVGGSTAVPTVFSTSGTTLTITN